MSEVIPSLCNTCAHETEHDIIHHRANQLQQGDEVRLTEYKTVACRGCRETSLRIEMWHFDYLPEPGNKGKLIGVEYQPPRLWHRPPDWLDNLEEVDADLKGLLDEVYSVCNDQQIRLLSMGIRTALDRVMVLILGNDIGSFEQKLDAMVDAGNLTRRQRDNLSIVIDAGSASSHRAYRPPTELVKEMVAVAEGIIRDHYFTGPMLQTAKQQIPPRPPSRKPK